MGTGEGFLIQFSVITKGIKARPSRAKIIQIVLDDDCSLKHLDQENNGKQSKGRI